MLEDLAQDLSGKAEIVKFNCNAKNKDLGKSLNIKVAPTFHIYKNSNKVSLHSNPFGDLEFKQLFGGTNVDRLYYCFSEPALYQVRHFDDS